MQGCVLEIRNRQIDSDRCLDYDRQKYRNKQGLKIKQQDQEYKSDRQDIYPCHVLGNGGLQIFCTRQISR